MEERKRENKKITIAAGNSFHFKTVLGVFGVPAFAGGDHPNGIGEAGLPGTLAYREWEVCLFPGTGTGTGGNLPGDQPFDCPDERPGGAVT